MTYEKSSGELWNCLLADGTFDLTRIAKKYEERYGYDVCSPDVAILDLIQNIRKNRRRKIHQPTHNDIPRGKLQCEFPYACHFKYPICDTYLLGVNLKSGHSSESASRYYTQIVEEFRSVESNRFLLLTFSNCKDMEQCTKDALDDIGFEPYPREAYKNYRRFSHAAKTMMQDSIEYFEAPCVKLFEYLKKGGFSGIHD